MISDKSILLLASTLVRIEKARLQIEIAKQAINSVAVERFNLAQEQLNDMEKVLAKETYPLKKVG